MAVELQCKSATTTITGGAFEAAEFGHPSKNFDDDGRDKRTGTVLTASAHIITAVIGSGVLSLSWAIAQLGWVAGPAVLILFSFITYFTSTLLADCYRSPDPVTGKRNYTYMDVVRSHLGGVKVQLCGLAQYGNLVGITVGYTITASISMAYEFARFPSSTFLNHFIWCGAIDAAVSCVMSFSSFARAVQRSNCFYREGHHAECYANNNGFIIIFACFQLVLSQISNFHKLSWLSIVAAVMSFAYSTIGLGLSIAKVAEGGHETTSLTGTAVGVDVSCSEKVWRTFESLGDIAFAYAYATVLIEIQDTLKSGGAPENKVMKRASLVGVSTTTVFYMLCGCLGYAAFGNNAPGNFLTGFGFYDPFWLIDIGNICIAIHLIGAYQVFSQPIFQFVENKCSTRWPDNAFLSKGYLVHIPLVGQYHFNLFRLVWRSVYVVFTAVVAMILPFFNDFLGLLGAFAFWPLTVYFPIEMHISQSKVPTFSQRWILLKTLSFGCLIVSLVAAAGSIQGLVRDVGTYKPFRTPS